MNAPKKLAILVSYSGDGGVERVINLLAAECARHVAVDLLTLKFRGRHLQSLPGNVRLVRLQHTSAWSAHREIATYLREHRPDVLLAAKDRAGRAALRARHAAGGETRVWLQIHSNPARAVERQPAWLRWLRLRPMRRWYPRAAGIIAVSQGLRSDLIRVLGLPADCVHAICNPVITDDIARLAAAPVPHVWLAEKLQPVLIAVGRMTRQKDFATLLRAFASLRRERPLRLIVLGDGELRGELEALARSLDIASDVLFAGFQQNPYAWMARADAFVLSSAWEGSPTVLTEALSLGLPVASTNCPSGPEELLCGGRYGPLVPVGDDAALSVAMRQVLDSPLPAALLRSAVQDYHAAVSARRYLELVQLL